MQLWNHVQVGEILVLHVIKFAATDEIGEVGCELLKGLRPVARSFSSVAGSSQVVEQRETEMEPRLYLGEIAGFRTISSWRYHQ